MAITNTLHDFVIKGIKDLRFYNTDGDMVAEINKLTSISISDETSKAELRGGLGNPLLLNIFGDRTCELTAENSTLSMAQLSLMLGASVTVETVDLPKYEKSVAISDSTATITGVPATGANVTVYTTNSYVENVVLLEKVDSDPVGNQFSITGSVITVPSTITGSLNVYYFESEESEVLEAVTSDNTIFKCYADCLLQSISNSKLYAGNILMPNVQVSPSITISGKNSADAPDASDIVLDLLNLNGDAPYSIICREVDSSDEI
jgi:hypothetical protein